MKKTTYLADHHHLTQSIPGLDLAVLQESFICYFDNGEPIIKEADSLNYLYVILEGRAKIVANQDNGKRLILQFLEADDLIGELAIVEAKETTKDVIAIGDTLCLGIPTDIVTRKLLTNNDFLLFLSRYIGKKLIQRMTHLKEQQTQELKIRVAKLLLATALDGTYNEKHTEIAEYLGVSYRHFLHTFKYFKDNGYLTKVGTHYEVDLKKLTLFVHSFDK